MPRPSKEEIFMELALTWAGLSTCSKRIAVGAVLVNEFQQVIASGYNGAPRGLPHCDEVGCDDDGHNHRVIHAEENALLQCAFIGTSTRGSIMYVTHPPCYRCSLRIIQAGIVEVVWLREYGNIPYVSQVLREGGVEIRRLFYSEDNNRS